MTVTISYNNDAKKIIIIFPPTTLSIVAAHAKGPMATCEYMERFSDSGKKKAEDEFHEFAVVRKTFGEHAHGIDSFELNHDEGTMQFSITDTNLSSTEEFIQRYLDGFVPFDSEQRTLAAAADFVMPPVVATLFRESSSSYNAQALLLSMMPSERPSIKTFRLDEKFIRAFQERDLAKVMRDTASLSPSFSP